MGVIILHVLDVSLLEHTSLERVGDQQASAELVDVIKS